MNAMTMIAHCMTRQQGEPPGISTTRVAEMPETGIVFPDTAPGYVVTAEELLALG